MTAKTISTSGYVGYSLGAIYDSLTITASGGISGTNGKNGGAGGSGGAGGVALTVDHVASVANSGTIAGGAGGVVGSGGASGGAGGIGVYFTAAATLNNASLITGGDGGEGAASASGGVAAAAVVLKSGGTVENGGTISGGLAGVGFITIVAASGDGIDLLAGGMVANNGHIGGQIGISGGSGGVTNVENYGGIRAVVGVSLAGSGSSLYNAAAGYVYGQLGAVTLSATATITNNGSMRGGSGYDGINVGAAATGAIINSSSSGYIYGWNGVESSTDFTLTNYGSIGGQRDGVRLLDTGVVTNYGSISGVSFGVEARGAATIVNQAGDVISGGVDSVYLAGVGGVAENYGALSGTAELFAAGCTLINGSATDTTASIAYGFYGVYASAAGTITNFGSIEVTGSGRGVRMAAGGTLFNKASGTIQGGYEGFFVSGAGTVVNYGYIQSTGRDSFNSSSGRMVVGAGSSVVGVINGDYLATLEIGGGTAGSTGTISNLGQLNAALSGGASADFRDFNAYVIDAGASWTVASGILKSGRTVTDDGTLSIGGSFENDGQIFGGAGANGTYGYAGKIGIDAVHGGALADFTNTGTVTGGAGGTGGGNGPGRSDFDGAAGGTGVSIASGGSITNGGQIDGGQGADGLAGSGGPGGSGGGGGTGLISSGGSNSGLIEGGAGGAAGDGFVSGFGGSGGTGVSLAGGGSFSNTGTILGGAGGAPGVGIIFSFPGGQQGNGVNMAAGLLTNGYAGEIGQALIEGGAGVYTSGVSATVDNFGTIEGTSGVSVQFQAASDRLIAENGSTFIGSVQGGNGVLELAGGTGTIAALGASYGTISGGVSAVVTGFHAYQLDTGGSWTLQGANTIGGAQALYNAGTMIIAPGASLTDGGELNNSGVIDIGGAAGKAYAGLAISGNQFIVGGGSVSLGATGYIGGVVPGDALTIIGETIVGGGFIRGPLTLTNEGTIDNSVGRMVLNTGNEVVNDGLVESSGTGSLLIRNTVINSSSGGSVVDAHSIILSNGTLEHGALTITAGGLLTNDAKGGTVILFGGTVVNAGTIAGATGGLNIAGDVANSGMLEALGGTLTVNGGVSGAGKVRLWGKGVVEIDGALSENVFFAAGSTGTLVLGDAGHFTGRIYGFSNTSANHIDLKNLAFDSTDTAKFTGSAVGGTLTIYNSTNVVLASLKLTGHYLSPPSPSTFTLADDGSGGTLITDPPATTTQLSQAMAGFGASGATTSAVAAATTVSAPPSSLSRPTG